MTRLPPVAPAARRTQAASKEVMPFKPGQIIGKVPFSSIKGTSDLTAEELAILQQGGYREGDPIPDLAKTAAGRRLREQVEDIAREAADIDGLLPVDPKTPPLQLLPAKDINEMPAAEAMKAMQVFKEMGELRARIEEARAGETIDMPPIAPPIELIDDIGLTEGKPRLKLKRAEPEPVKVEPTKVQPAPAEDTHGSNITNVLITCPRCNHNLNGELVTPTVEDKVGYIALVMGEQKRFHRVASLFGGRITVTFRSLTTAEENLVFTQVDTEAKDGKIGNLVLYAAAIEDYKMLLSIESVQRKGKPALKLEPIAAYEFDDKKHKTALPEYKDWLDAEVFLAASVRHAVVHAYNEFKQVLQYMEVKAPDSDFFAGIA